MPELPEVETSRRGIHSAVVNHTIQQVIIRDHRLRWPIPNHLSDTLCQQTIVALTRRGKYLLFHTEQGTLILHLGMSGYLKITDSNTPPIKHDHVDLVFDQYCLRYHDPRRFGCLLWTHEDPAEHRLLHHLGPEPLTRHFNATTLYNAAKRRQIAVKAFIMNHTIVVGVGNIYASESLFLAGIHPKRPANSISLNEYRKLCDAIKKVLKRAIKAGGTTLKDFKKADGKPGYFQQALHVYDQYPHPCQRCASPIEKTIIAQRSTYYCPHCQK